MRHGNGYDYGHWLWKDPTAWGAFDIFGMHEYDSQIAYAWPADVNGGMRNKEIWQTEMSGVRYWPEEGPTSDHPERCRGRRVDSLGAHRSARLRPGSGGGTRLLPERQRRPGHHPGSSTLPSATYTMGNYSKFVRPGYVAVDVIGNSNANVLLSAYKGTDGTVVVVAVNKGTAAVTVPISITGGTAPAL